MRILFSAHDAGGAHAIVPVVVALKAAGVDVIVRADGPAADICASRGIATSTRTAFAEGADAYIFGTSAGETIEKAIFLSVQGRMPTVAVLDYWSNYAVRFSRRDRDFAYLPDRICVMDDIARDEMIAEGFDPARIVVTGNPHFDHFADAITSDREDAKRLLFISQPLSVMAREPGYAAYPFDEFTALADVVAACKIVLPEYRLAIRSHPKERAGKYKRVLDDRVALAKEATLEQALSRSGLIVGMNSVVLLQAVAAGKPVLSYEPGLKGPDPLVSNRLGVTRSVHSSAELADALERYASGTLPVPERSMRDVWPPGATERVVEAALSLIREK